MEPPAGQSERAHHQHCAERLDDQKQGPYSDKNQSFGAEVQDYLDDTCQAADLSNVRDQLRGVALQMKRERLSQIASKEPLRETGVNRRHQTCLIPSAETQEKRLHDVQPDQDQHAGNDQPFTTRIAETLQQRREHRIPGPNVFLNDQCHRRYDRTNAHGFEHHADDHQAQQTDGHASLVGRKNVPDLPDGIHNAVTARLGVKRTVGRPLTSIADPLSARVPAG